MTNTRTVYRLVVDTTQYAGNFERESIAYATGLVGECGVGQGEAEQAEEELDPEILEWWEENGLSAPDDHGCCRPAMIRPTPGFFNHGYGGHFPATEEGRAAGLEEYKKKATDYALENLARLQLVVVGENRWTQEGLDREIAESQRKIVEIEATTQVNEHPSYQSVGIEVEKLPPQSVIRSFEDRMKSFLGGKNIKILDFVLETETIQTEYKRSPMPRM